MTNVGCTLDRPHRHTEGLMYSQQQPWLHFFPLLVKKLHQNASWVRMTLLQVIYNVDSTLMEKREPVTNFRTLPIISIKFTCHTLQLMGSWHCGCKLQRCEHSHWGQEKKKKLFFVFFFPQEAGFTQKAGSGAVVSSGSGGSVGGVLFIVHHQVIPPRSSWHAL